MITRTLAIAWLTLQEAVRSKLLLSLATLLVAGLVVMMPEQQDMPGIREQ